jgi:hypothetical protein
LKRGSISLVYALSSSLYLRGICGELMMEAGC